MIKYEAIIGLEIHAELKTNSKMFCSCKNDPFNSKQNENICPVCLGMPGILPVLNKQAIEWTILTGLALNCKISEFTKWDRKNYFYPDLPKGYQISQYDLPICSQGYLEISRYKTPLDIAQGKQDTKNNQNSNDNKSKKVHITRIHLEEDTGTSKHPEGRAEVDYSLMDYNRAGTPLMELVTEPDMTSAEEVKAFCQKYQLILRNLGVSDANMEQGQMRCEPTINLIIEKNGKKYYTPLVEIKNINSFRFVEKALNYEIKRQLEEFEETGVIKQHGNKTTRGWDEKTQTTYLQRKKEESSDYRYFPEPDLPPVKITESSIKKLEASMPEMPDVKKERYIKEYKLGEKDAEIIINDIKKANFFENCFKLNTKYQIPASKLSSWIINEVPDLSVTSKQLVELLDLVEKNEISGKIAKEILPEIKKGKSPNDIIKEKGIKQISDSGELETIVDKILKANPDAVEKIKKGNMGVVGFLVGQIMRETRGQADPKLVQDILKKKI